MDQKKILLGLLIVLVILFFVFVGKGILSGQTGGTDGSMPLPGVSGVLGLFSKELSPADVTFSGGEPACRTLPNGWAVSPGASCQLQVRPLNDTPPITLPIMRSAEFTMTAGLSMVLALKVPKFPDQIKLDMKHPSISLNIPHEGGSLIFQQCQSTGPLILCTLTR